MRHGCNSGDGVCKSGGDYEGWGPVVGVEKAGVRVGVRCSSENRVGRTVVSCIVVRPGGDRVCISGD